VLTAVRIAGSALTRKAVSQKQKHLNYSSTHRPPASDHARPHLNDPISLLNLARVGTKKPVGNSDLPHAGPENTPARGSGSKSRVTDLRRVTQRWNPRCSQPVRTAVDTHTGFPSPATTTHRCPSTTSIFSTHDMTRQVPVPPGTLFSFSPSSRALDERGLARTNGPAFQRYTHVEWFTTTAPTLFNAHREGRWGGRRTGHPLRANVDRLMTQGTEAFNY